MVPKYFLSTSVFVMFTDQYHLNNFIQKTAINVGVGNKNRRG